MITCGDDLGRTGEPSVLRQLLTMALDDAPLRPDHPQGEPGVPLSKGKLAKPNVD